MNKGKFFSSFDARRKEDSTHNRRYYDHFFPFVGKKRRMGKNNNKFRKETPTVVISSGVFLDHDKQRAFFSPGFWGFLRGRGGVVSDATCQVHFQGFFSSSTAGCFSQFAKVLMEYHVFDRFLRHLPDV